MPDYKVDFHTHSILSHDGGITLDEYERILDSGILDYVAITDHNEVDLALEASENLGNKIIVGEEIKTSDGEVIGLYLKQRISGGISIEETIKEIKEQEGIVYIPHPVNKRGVSVLNKKLHSIKDQIDIIEIFNAKNIFGRFNDNPRKIQTKLDKVGAVGSDSHSLEEVGRTYNIIDDKLNKNNLIDLLQKADHQLSYIKPMHMLNPKLNKLKKYLNG